MYEVLYSYNAKIDQITIEKLEEMESEYYSLDQRHGASITELVRIGRREGSLHYLLEDAVFYLQD
jgi:hypothetical protein